MFLLLELYVGLIVLDHQHDRIRRDAEDNNLKKIKQAMVLHSMLKKIVNQEDNNGMWLRPSYTVPVQLLIRSRM